MSFASAGCAEFLAPVFGGESSILSTFRCDTAYADLQIKNVELGDL
jgi:hypothetical protein